MIECTPFPTALDDDDAVASIVEGQSWTVVYTRPRCEKKFAEFALHEGLHHELPLIKSVKHYRDGTKRFTKPLFPGYVFVRIEPAEKQRLFQRDLVVRLHHVPDEPLFCQQLKAVRAMIRTELPLQLTALRKGTRVRIVGGPLFGVEGTVDDPDNPRGVIIAIDVLQQGVLVRLPPDHIERVA